MRRKPLCRPLAAAACGLLRIFGTGAALQAALTTQDQLPGDTPLVALEEASVAGGTGSIFEEAYALAAEAAPVQFVRAR